MILWQVWEPQDGDTQEHEEDHTVQDHKFTQVFQHIDENIHQWPKEPTGSKYEEHSEPKSRRPNSQEIAEMV